MDPERWQNCIDIFKAIVERPPGERSALLDQTCEGDDALRRKVELLLRYHEETGDFIETPAFEVSPELLLDNADALIGENLGHYRIESVLGVGGMGVVYLAQDEKLGRKVGLKLLPQSLVADETQLERLKREARTASALNHPNIVTIHEIGEVDGTHYIATEFIEGMTLRERLAQEPIAPNEAVEIAQQIVSALSVAHGAGIVHCDIKPENIMLRPDGYVKVLDFGIAKFTQQENKPAGVEGTKRYMSPEQARGEELDARSDIWSLGVTLREMLVGSARSGGTGAVPSQLSGRHGGRPSTILPAALERVISRALSEKREARYASAAELRADLQRVQRELEASPLTRWRIAAAAVAAVAVAGVAYVKLFSPSSAQPVSEIKSLAVLPLQNLSGDAAQEYFADGMTDELIGELAQLTQLRVISRTSTMQYKGSKKSLPRIAQELQVDAIIEGTVQRADGRVRIRAQLIEARSDRHLWAHTYERDLQNVLKLQSDIAQAIAREVRAKTTPADLARLTSRPPVRPKAFDDYLQGRYLYWNKRTVENLGKAIDYFESAIREDPTYALPYLGVAECYNAMGNVQFGALPPPEARGRAEGAALKALELDPTLAEAHSVLGAVRFLRWDWTAVEEEFKRAIALNPSSANSHNLYATYLMSRGRTDEVFAASNRARELDPLSLAISAQRGFLLFLARRYGESIEQLRGIIATDPNHYQGHFFLAHTFAANGQLDDAIAEAEKAAALSASPGALGTLGMVHGFAGKKDEARKVVHELLELNQRRYVTPAALVFAYTGLGDTDQAFLWLEKCAQERSNFMVHLKLLPSLDPLRSDPRFEEMLRRIYPPNDLSAPAPSPNEKSIAVLPFADLSQSRDQEYFCDGIQEEILTRLAKVADLKVISRTSTQLYKAAPKNLPEIAKQLGVAHILEGSVKKANGQVRVSAQLIDARTDTHLWAQSYERGLADLFAIQSDIAQQIATQLQAKLSQTEEAALLAKPTQDMLAYDFYLRAKEIERGVSGALPEKLNEKVFLLNQAVARDAAFVPALCLLARAHLEIYWFNLDHTETRLELASKALDAAARAQPDAGEVHLARAIRFYWGSRDYASALAELTHARRLLPNDADTLQFLAFIERRQGQWEESIRHLEEARAIDPRNAATIGELAFEYVSLRRYREAARIFEGVLVWKPEDFTVQLGRALVDVEAKADLRRLQSIIFGETAKAGDAALLGAVRIRLALWQRDYQAAEQALASYPSPDITERGYVTPREFFVGVIARGRGDATTAHTAFLAAREKAAAMVTERPEDAKALITLAEIDACLGRKAGAIRESEDASKLLPVSKDTFDGPDILARVAGILAQVGETHRALDLLEQVTTMPGAPSLTRPCYGRLQLDEVWDPLRGDPRFEKIVASLAPKEAPPPAK